MPGSSIGVITPYQAQVQLLKSYIAESDIEVNTVDQYQGRDKSVIVLSFARTTASSSNHRGGVSCEGQRFENSHDQNTELHRQ